MRRRLLFRIPSAINHDLRPSTVSFGCHSFMGRTRRGRRGRNERQQVGLHYTLISKIIIPNARGPFLILHYDRVLFHYGHFLILIVFSWDPGLQKKLLNGSLDNASIRIVVEFYTNPILWFCIAKLVSKGFIPIIGSTIEQLNRFICTALEGCLSNVAL